MSLVVMTGTTDQHNGTNGLLFLLLMSGTLLDGKFIGVHVDDVAIAHIRALASCGSTAKSLQSYLVSCKRNPCREVNNFVKTLYPNVPIELDPVDSTKYTVDS
jgi:hypothetical protein